MNPFENMDFASAFVRSMLPWMNMEAPRGVQVAQEQGQEQEREGVFQRIVAFAQEARLLPDTNPNENPVWMQTIRNAFGQIMGGQAQVEEEEFEEVDGLDSDENDE